MRIADIQTAVIAANYDWTLIRIRTDDGAVGYGESLFAPGLTRLIRDFKPLLLGRQVDEIHPIGRTLQTAGVAAGLLGGIVTNAIAGIESALWDLMGQSLGVPMFKLFGGAYRTSIRLYADCHAGEGLSSLSSVIVPRVPWWMSASGEDEYSWDVHTKFHGGLDKEAGEADPQAYGKRAAQVAALGYSAVKFDVDIPNPYSRDRFNRCLDSREIELMRSLVAAVREAVPDAVEDSLRLAEACKPYNLLWLEDPTPPDSFEALKQVISHAPVPIATGENHFLRSQFHDLFNRSGLRLAAPDFQKTGLAEGRRIAELAEIFAAVMVPHNISSPIGTMASAHLCAALPNFLVLEHHGIEVPFWEELALGWDGPIIREGHIQLDPTRPGLGISFNEEEAYKYRNRAEPFFDEK
jgi:L-alanine-DL-glutamate epimerase-like enolase superfamily enzyme